MDSSRATFGQVTDAAGAEHVLRGAGDFRVIGAPVEFLAHLQSQAPVTPQFLANPAAWPQGAGFPLPMPSKIGSSDNDSSTAETDEAGASLETEDAGQASIVTAAGNSDRIETKQHQAAMTAMAAEKLYRENLQTLSSGSDRFASYFQQAA